MTSYWLVGTGVVLLALGVVGIRSAGAIVEKQRREGMTAFADAPIDDATRVTVTRYVAAVLIVLGFGLVVIGVGLI